MKRFIILVGNYGSGKTEIAMNFALNASKTGKTLLIDLDMINTYFRLSDRRDLFEGTGVEMIAPHFANSGVEMLTVPAEIAKAFDMDWDTVIIDLGGDAGASALGQYQPPHGRYAGKAAAFDGEHGTQGPLEGDGLHPQHKYVL